MRRTVWDWGIYYHGIERGSKLVRQLRLRVSLKKWIWGVGRWTVQKRAGSVVWTLASGEELEGDRRHREITTAWYFGPLTLACLTYRFDEGLDTPFHKLTDEQIMKRDRRRKATRA